MTDEKDSGTSRAAPRGLGRAFQCVRYLGDGTRMTVTWPAKLHAYQHLCVAFVESGVLPGGVAYRVRHKGQAVHIPTPDGPEPLLVVNHEPGCPIAYDPATDRFTRWCDCNAGLHLPVCTVDATADA